MKPFLKRLSWTTAHSVLHMMRMYVASTWLGFRPLMFPSVQHTQQVNIWQTMYRVGAPKLFIPDDVQQDLAFSLLRVRRRAIRIAILQDDRWRWVSAWVRKKWTYLGHLLRRGLRHGATSSMLACARDQQVGARWSSSYNWLLSTCKLVYHVDAAPTPSQLVKWASNRQVWASKADAVVHRYKHSCKQVHFHSFTSIRRLIALHYIASSLKDFLGAGLCILFILRKVGCTY